MTIGIVGGGQLARMLALAGYPLGQDFLVYDRHHDVPAGRLAPLQCGEFSDQSALGQFAARCEVISFDWENISVPALRAATRGSGARIAPPLRALATAQDRLQEKRLFERLGIPTTTYANVENPAQWRQALRRIGTQGVLKTRRLGYDGKGQRVIDSAASAASAFAALGDQALLYEEFVPYDYEVSIIGARSRRGELAIYPLCRNVHADGILRLTMAPWRAPALERLARRYLQRVLSALDYVGVLAIEFFVRQGRLVANEMAPRVHNSGHWSIEGAVTSQFANHVRAIAGLPLGSTALLGHSLMLNLIGRMPHRRTLLAVPGLHLHDYGKSARPGRKLGHCTMVCPSAAARLRWARHLVRQFYPELGRLA